VEKWLDETLKYDVKAELTATNNPGVISLTIHIMEK